MPQFDLSIFDLDGTPIDSRLDLAHSVNATVGHRCVSFHELAIHERKTDSPTETSAPCFVSALSAKRILHENPSSGADLTRFAVSAVAA